MVTGSNIPTAAEVGPNPVQIIDRPTIERSGERTAEQLLKDLPIANANGVPISSNNGALSQGASSISLRGLDPGATLVLIDGRRVTPFPSGTADGSELFIDLNSIPVAAIEGIEILKDGASTTYGADAVAGVVNIKLRRNYNGAEASIEYGNTTHHDSNELAASLVFGVGQGDTSLSGVINYYRRDAIFDRDRSYSKVADPLSSNSDPYNLELSRAAVIAAGGNPDPSLGDTFFGHAPFFGNGTAPASAYTYTAGRSVSFNIQKFTSVFPASERYGGFINAEHKLFGDKMVLYGDLFYQRDNVHNEQAPSNTNDFEQSAGVVIAIPPHAPGATLGGPTYVETGVTPGAFNPFNPFQQIISGATRARLVDFGNRMFDNDTDAFFTTWGVKGDKLFDGSWGYDLGLRYSRIQSTINFLFPSATKFNRVLNAADPIFDPTSPQYIGTTIPFNSFGDYRRPIASNRKLLDFVRVHAEEPDTGTLLTADLNIYTTDLFHLPAGGVGLAFGAQFQHETIEQDPSKAQVQGDLVGAGLYSPVKGSRDEDAAYAELSIPVFGSEFRIPGFHGLDFTAAVRYEEFRNNDTNVMVPKFGVRWQPFDDSLTIRATWGEGFKEPTLIHLFAPPAAFIALNVFDPVTKQRLAEVPALFIPNPNLQSEDSRSFNGGLVYTPKFIQGLTLSVDLFDIETTGWINPNPDPAEVLRRIAAGQALPGESATRDANGNLLSLTESYENSGTQKVRGVDLGLQYQRQTTFGVFTSVTQVTYLDSYQFASAPGATELELRSSPIDFTSVDAYLRWKGTSRLDWAWHGFDLALTANYRDGFHELLNFGPNFPNGIKEHWVKQTWFFDLQVSYDFNALVPARDDSVPGVAVQAESPDGKAISSAPVPTVNSARPAWDCLLRGVRLTVGCTDLFDHSPPSSIGNYPRHLYDPTDRFVYVSLRKKF